MTLTCEDDTKGFLKILQVINKRYIDNNNPDQIKTCRI